MKKFLILFAATLIGMSACDFTPEESFVIYNDTELCSVVNGKILTDNNLIYEVVENEANAKLEDYDRVVIVCDIVKLNQDGSYQIKLKSISKIQTKDFLESTSLSEGEALSMDPISLQSIWFSGGYLNIGFAFYAKTGSTNPHTIDLIVQRPSEAGEKLTFYLRHNAEGENVTENNFDDYNLVGSYISFRAEEFFPANSSTEIDVKWVWYRDNGTPDSADVIEFSETGTIERKN